MQAQHGLTLTGLYNVLEKLRSFVVRPSGRPDRDDGLKAGLPTLTDKEREIHDKGLVSLLKQLHDELDAAVFAAYGWPATLTDAEILERLVALNAERAAEEQRGILRWLRPDYQNPQGGESKTQTALELTEGEGRGEVGTVKSGSAKVPWPKPLAERIRATEQALHAAGTSVTAADLAKRFLRASEKDVQEILESLVALGRAHRSGETFRA